ncbi:hypothetical protein CBS101457_002463 [Exobasidium rhododendri]|nr:hypothetical protein CBS101457_002463 [Exobasidium rhododendri]
MSALKSSSPSQRSESQHTETTSDSNIPLLHSENDETPSLVRELQEAALVLPARPWSDEAIVSILVPEEGGVSESIMCSIAKTDVENHSIGSETFKDERQPQSLAPHAYVDKGQGWYQHSKVTDRKMTTTVSSQSHVTVLQASADCPAFIPISSSDTQSAPDRSETASNVDDEYENWVQSATYKNKKRSRAEYKTEACLLQKGKERGSPPKVWAYTSSDDYISDVESEGAAVEPSIGYSPRCTGTADVDEQDWMHSSETVATETGTGKQFRREDTPHGSFNAQRDCSPEAERDGRGKHGLVEWRNMDNDARPADIRRRTLWPTWLHPAFQRETDIFVPRVSRSDLTVLYKAILTYDHSIATCEVLFNNVFGPFLCEMKTQEMLETVRAVGIRSGQPHLANIADDTFCNRNGSATKWLLSRDLFIERFLGSVPSYAAFLERELHLKTVVPAHLYKAYRRGLRWWWDGEQFEDEHNKIDEYEVWAMARLIELEKDRERPLRPEDLHTPVRMEWQDRVDQCTSWEDAMRVAKGKLKSHLEPMRLLHLPTLSQTPKSPVE